MMDPVEAPASPRSDEIEGFAPSMGSSRMEPSVMKIVLIPDEGSEMTFFTVGCVGAGGWMGLLSWIGPRSPLGMLRGRTRLRMGPPCPSA